MDATEYSFRIDAFTPDTLPMARLAEYLAALAKLLGYSDHTHFVRVDPGSARLVHKIDPVDAPKVDARMSALRRGDGTKDAIAARNTLEDLLANDNAVGSLTEVASGQVVLPFVGRNRPKPMTFPPFRENTTIDGQVVGIGGRDATAHATLQDGEVFHTNLSMKRDMARQLGKLLYGPSVRLHGNGRFERQPDGNWKLHDFKVERMEVLDDRPIAEVLAALRKIPDNGLMAEDAYTELLRERTPEGEDL